MLRSEVSIPNPLRRDRLIHVFRLRFIARQALSPLISGYVHQELSSPLLSGHVHQEVSSSGHVHQGLSVHQELSPLISGHVHQELSPLISGHVHQELSPLISGHVHQELSPLISGHVHQEASSGRDAHFVCLDVLLMSCRPGSQWTVAFGPCPSRSVR